MNRKNTASKLEILSAYDVNVDVAPKVSAVLRAERDILVSLVEQIEGSGWHHFSKALSLLNAVEGRVMTTGMGKSGHIAKKVAATMSSLGAPASFVHPGEASHGDLGMITEKDALLAFSNSGNTSELGDILAHANNIGIPVIGITMGVDSKLARASTVVIFLPKMDEGCPLGLAPTTSTTAQLAVGDALSVGLSVMRDFKRDNFNTLHPGGSLGKTTTKITEVMIRGQDMPLVDEDAEVAQIIWEMARKEFDIVGVVNANGELVGLITNNHIRPDDTGTALQLMHSPDPVINEEETLGTAVTRMGARNMKSIFVVRNGKPVGVVRNPK